VKCHCLILPRVTLSASPVRPQKPRPLHHERDSHCDCKSPREPPSPVDDQAVTVGATTPPDPYEVLQPVHLLRLRPSECLRHCPNVRRTYSDRHCCNISIASRTPLTLNGLVMQPWVRWGQVRSPVVWLAVEFCFHLFSSGRLWCPQGLVIFDLVLTMV